MAFDSRRLDRFEASGTHLAQAVREGKGAAILQDTRAKLGAGAALGQAEHFARHVPDEP
jgi:hypothetical protein